MKVEPNQRILFTMFFMVVGTLTAAIGVGIMSDSIGAALFAFGVGALISAGTFYNITSRSY